jgi:hypothetical protein
VCSLLTRIYESHPPLERQEEVSGGLSMMVDLL